MIIEKHFIGDDGEELVELGIGYEDLVQTIANFKDLKEFLMDKLKRAGNVSDAKELGHDFDVSIQAMTMLAVNMDESGDKKMKTNADVIRGMTDSELIEFMGAVEEGDIDYSVTFCDLCEKDRKEGGKGNEPGYDCDACFRSWVLGSAYAYNGLLSSGLNSGYVERADEK